MRLWGASGAPGGQESNREDSDEKGAFEGDRRKATREEHRDGATTVVNVQLKGMKKKNTIAARNESDPRCLAVVEGYCIRLADSSWSSKCGPIGQRMMHLVANSECIVCDYSGEHQHSPGSPQISDRPQHCYASS